MKRAVRNLLWTIKGRGTQNPPLPARVRSVLFVCLGNICRSPFGAHLAERLLNEAGLQGIRCSSAGLRPSQAMRSPDEACEASARFGLSLVEHVPQAVTRELIESHDMVWVMEHGQFVQLRAEYPEHADRIFLMSLLDPDARGGYERYNIADPFGCSLALYHACYERMARALRHWIGKMPREVRN
jgi:protein-tyrosine phosphatase